MSIYIKLNEFRKKVGAIKRDGTNPHFKNKYATIESVLDTIESPLNQSGLGFIQCVHGLELITTIYDTESDERIESKIPLLLNKQDMQQLGGAITYARRYALVSMLGLEQEDDDGNYASGNNPKQQTKQQEIQKPAVKVIERINESQVLELESLFASNEHKQDFLTTCKITKLNELPASWFAKAVENLKK
jgi:hypothetical protein